ncbi:hypothetical protein AGABI2DRAFT_142198 [Agaricus bisporus var. bisporus H97]|uniref:hypothetical protein n=1 Tax=Agaricus bisporus var. bisporus (strain H97 / ATCC MYA-4626 / FGSC 10389) TaxID=936046 RepID=UPI00029F693F|nr:hypothetical protein AGABI2DRAFT_142198 [Agaricus bisporus var. bisporus H97]EKV47890.1 hypothetical protein AGABI2DRAFT_142198 [Agaricus bisporus var. bisporus H97]
MSLWSAPHHVSDNTLDFEEVERRFEEQEAEMYSHISLTEELTGEASPIASLDLPCGDLSPILDSDQHPTDYPPTSFPSFHNTPEYIAEQVEIVAPRPVQRRNILDQDAFYNMDSGDSVQPEDHLLPFAPPDHTFDTFSQHSLVPQEPQNVCDAWEAFNALGGMNYDQPMDMTNNTPSLSNLNHMKMKVQSFEFKLISVFVPTANPYTIQCPPFDLPALNEFIPHHVPEPLMQAEAALFMDGPNDFVPLGQQNHGALWNSNVTTYHTPAPNMFPDFQPNIYAPQDQQLATPPECYYPDLGAASDPNPAAYINEYEPAF